MKPILYLDVDGVLWDIVDPPDPTAIKPYWAGPANGLEEFLEYAFRVFEVRWCTTWAMSGAMHPEPMANLYGHTKVPIETWQKVQPSKGWYDYKHENIDWDEIIAGREFAWVEDGLCTAEHETLRELGFTQSYYYTDVFDDPDALIKTTARLQERFGK